MPKRIQRKRTKGWRMPPNAVYVGRLTKWSNPYTVAGFGREGAVESFAEFAANCEALSKDARRELRGKDLACFCPLDQPCHADVLLRIANEPEG